MDTISFILNTNKIDIITYVIKIIFISLLTYYTFLKIINKKDFFCKNLFSITFFIITISILCSVMNYMSDSFTSILFLILLLSSLFSITTKNKIGYSLLVTTISLSINYIILFIAIALSFFPTIIFNVQNYYINLAYILLIYITLLFLLLKIKKVKYGLAFLQPNIKNDYFDIFILNISVIILFSFIILNNFSLLFTISFSIAFIIFSIIMFITIQKTLTMYYKHKLLVQDLQETKAELEESKKEVARLETENLNFSKTSHSIAHKQKALEYKLNELLTKTEIADELSLNDELKNISKKCFENKAVINLPKTEIAEIDNMLNLMQSECTKNNIEFELILNRNIHHITNTFIQKEDLEILLADLIKNSIIAINNSDNVNRSILVKLGLFDNQYILSVYDSGIEFKTETLSKLGIKPCSTHLDDGGSGMGFMNIFDTLNKTNSSIIINELNEPSKDNYTKFINIKFDNNHKFQLCSYRANFLKTNIKNENLEIIE